MKTSESRFAQCIYFATNALARKTERIALNAWSEIDLTPSHGYLLMLVVEQPGIQPGAIAEHLQLQPSTITRLVEKLERRKLLQRVTEGKATNIYPTSKGKDLYPKLEACAIKFTRDITGMAGKEDILKLLPGVGKMADKL